MRRVKRYLKYFAVAFKYFLSRKKYGAIVGWQQFYTLIFVFYCSLFRVKKRNTVVVLSFIYKDKTYIKTIYCDNVQNIITNIVYLMVLNSQNLSIKTINGVTKII